MKKAELIFSAILIPVDYLMIVLAALTAYSLRFQSDFFIQLRPIIYEIPFSEFFRVVLLVSLVWLLAFALAGLYNIKGNRKWIFEMSKVFFACTAGIMAVIILIFFRHELFSSRFIILAVWILSIFYVSFARTIIRMIQHLLYKKGLGVHHVILIGKDYTADQITKAISENPVLGYKIIKHFDEFNENVKNKISQILKTQKIDEIIQANPNLDKKQDLKLIDFCLARQIVFKYAADLFQTKTQNIDINAIAGIPIIELKQTPLDGWGRILKRVFDFLGSLFALIIFSPLMILIALFIRLESKGPAVYKNQRVSRYGKFNTYKFRTMYLEYCTGPGYDCSGQAEDYEKKLISEKSKRMGPVYKVVDDPRRTKVGKFLERTSLDEFPQFLNVLLGNMSLVGPRPHQPREVEKYKKHHRRVLAIKPGITGLAQISGRSDLDFDEEVKLDTHYIENWSLLLDLYIILKTPLVVLKRGCR